MVKRKGSRDGGKGEEEEEKVLDESIMDVFWKWISVASGRYQSAGLDKKAVQMSDTS